ncbi:Prolipoprotein diacylglyceryl transferase [Clostridium cavendishii DSM 21758]|uniref:Phosphatidylglycerol--prolipoprotein diacylglyceryl transferase n=1 Tax=Clostridium cavendishii DSM 21758 TaxID=1121302 RepID=A0A1M6PDC7_9CLOT|nr:prolipoprotein diacylglyceryl transferase [Clostridium cavendishii]SHK05927.1 Prolipoprotein diacylglyceryl transferase [Clostridium cavendishii DSM 21758]
MKPVLIKIFGLNVYGYGLMIALGIIVAMSILSRKAKSKGYNEDSIFNMTILAVICGILGGKILYIITEFSDIVKDPSKILIEFGNGFVIYGAIIGGAIGVYLYCRKKSWSFLDIFDMVVPGVAIAQGFGRIGCFLAGCCYGAETTSKLSVVFPDDSLSLAPAGVHLHPTQIYSSIFDFLLGLFLIWYSRKTDKKGRIFSLYLIIYSIGRFLVEIIRNDPRGNVGNLTTSQFIAIFTLALGIILYNVDKFKGRLLKSEN